MAIYTDVPAMYCAFANTYNMWQLVEIVCSLRITFYRHFGIEIMGWDRKKK